uniref:Uncharacterized protein n=1 Tax=Noctiluca scintillans TaxID=2966 RepID=A0A7S1AG64_NOCSC
MVPDISDEVGDVFWKTFGGQGCQVESTPLELLLQSPDCGIEDLLDEEDVVQQFKAGNDRLLSRLSQLDALETLIEFITCDPPKGASRARCYRYPFVSVELMTCGHLFEEILRPEHPQLLDDFWNFLDSPSKQVNSVLAGYFSRAASSFLVRHPTESVQYLRHRGADCLRDRFLERLHSRSLADLFARFLCVNQPAHVLFESDGLVLRLLARLEDQGSSDTYDNILLIVLELLRQKDNSCFGGEVLRQLVAPDALTLLVDFIFSGRKGTASAASSILTSVVFHCCVVKGAGAATSPGRPRLLGPPTPWGDDDDGDRGATLASDLCSYLPRIRQRLQELNSSQSTVRLPIGELPSAGSAAIDLIHFLTVLLKTRCLPVLEAVSDEGLLSPCLDIFFAHPWSSVVHNFVRLLILEILGYARDTDEGFAHVARFLHDSRLVERIAAEFAQEQPSTEYRRRPRVGYMGHLHMIACDLKELDYKAPSGVESLCMEPGWSVHIQPAIERTARIQAEELGGELNSTPRSLEEVATPRVETLGRGRPSSHHGASEEAPVRDVRAGSADRRREPPTTEGRGTQEPLRDLGPYVITEPTEASEAANPFDSPAFDLEDFGSEVLDAELPSLHVSSFDSPHEELSSVQGLIADTSDFEAVYVDVQDVTDDRAPLEDDFDLLAPHGRQVLNSSISLGGTRQRTPRHRQCLSSLPPAGPVHQPEDEGLFVVDLRHLDDAEDAESFPFQDEWREGSIRKPDLVDVGWKLGRDRADSVEDVVNEDVCQVPDWEVEDVKEHDLRLVDVYFSEIDQPFAEIEDPPRLTDVCRNHRVDGEGNLRLDICDDPVDGSLESDDKCLLRGVVVDEVENADKGVHVVDRFADMDVPRSFVAEFSTAEVIAGEDDDDVKGLTPVEVDVFGQALYLDPGEVPCLVELEVLTGEPDICDMDGEDSRLVDAHTSSEKLDLSGVTRLITYGGAEPELSYLLDKGGQHASLSDEDCVSAEVDGPLGEEDGGGEVPEKEHTTDEAGISELSDTVVVHSTFGLFHRGVLQEDVRSVEQATDRGAFVDIDVGVND